MFYTERLMLRGLDTEADFKYIFHVLNSVDYLWALRAEAPKPGPRESTKKFIQRLADKEDKLPFFIICKKPKEGDEPENLGVDQDQYLTKDGNSRYPGVGVLNISSPRGYSPSNRVGSLGIALDEEYQNSGYGTEAMAWAIKYCFNTLGMHKIELILDACNIRALHVYVKLGFRKEGLRRKNFFRDGKWEDTIDMGLLEEDWRGNNLSNGNGTH